MSSDEPTAPSLLRRLVARARTLALAYFALLATATHWPDDAQSFGGSDKVYHFAAFMLLAMFVLWGWEATLGRLEPKHFFAVWLAGTVYGAIDEWTQPYFHRQQDIHDWVADVAGVLVGLVLYGAVRSVLRRGEKTRAMSAE